MTTTVKSDILISMDYTDFVIAGYKRFNAEPDWRLGQSFFNVLREVRPDLAERVRGTKVDPFYVDDKVTDFLNFVGSRWEENGT